MNRYTVLFLVTLFRIALGDSQQPDVVHIPLIQKVITDQLNFTEVLTNARNRQQHMATTLGETSGNPAAVVKHTSKAIGAIDGGPGVLTSLDQPGSFNLVNLKALVNSILGVFFPPPLRQTSPGPQPTPAVDASSFILPTFCSYQYTNKQTCVAAFSSCVSTFQKCMTAAKADSEGICAGNNPVVPVQCNALLAKISSKAVSVTSSKVTLAIARTTSTLSSSKKSSTMVTPVGSTKLTISSTKVSTGTSRLSSSSKIISPSTTSLHSSTSIPSSINSSVKLSTTSSSPRSTSSSSTSSAQPASNSDNVAVQNDLWNSVMVVQALLGSSKALTMQVFDTGSTDSWAMTNQCSNCAVNGHHIFNTNNSGSFKSSTSSFSVTYGDGSSSSGHWGSDTLYVGSASATGQSIGIPTSVSSSWVSAGYTDGIIGLAYPALGTSGHTPFIQNLYSQNQIPQPIVGMAIDSASFSGSQYQTGGTLTLGGVNPSFISGSLTAVPVTRQLYWQVTLDGIKVATSNSATGTSVSGSSVIVDSGTTLILLSDSQVSAIYAAIGGSSSSGTWIYPCQNTKKLYFQLGGKWFGIPASGLFFNWADSTQVMCIGTVQSYGNIGLAILGEAFLRYVYASFDFTDNTVKLGTRSDLPAVS
ncbi:Pepsin A [Neolecta irregularis DAH-3]|uniref:Pepsin A n=1 Tax=Neolecta irregularis (strain DAH-3) TaxID=1198029 RepID=A0A1U7LH99_NEOID|nr:Pepsin A [Neolecta irregularis DAH-3]|eukprot:OLL22019.1 Pepsin A [Neolecta irregularis DAH-3]